jgi:hypothetical protein
LGVARPLLLQLLVRLVVQSIQVNLLLQDLAELITLCPSS